jgi:hypothetical protein
MNYPFPKKMNYPITGQKKVKKSKYHNKKVLYDNIKFDSEKERDRYIQLKLMEKAGEIKDLKLQVKFELQPSFEINGKTIKSIDYIADFEYYTNDEFALYNHIVEDTKGFKTKEYMIKRKMFAYKYKFEISEV